jgi:hypothetical protein
MDEVASQKSQSTAKSLSTDLVPGKNSEEILVPPTNVECKKEEQPMKCVEEKPEYLLKGQKRKSEDQEVFQKPQETGKSFKMDLVPRKSFVRNLVRTEREVVSKNSLGPEKRFENILVPKIKVGAWDHSENKNKIKRKEFCGRNPKKKKFSKIILGGREPRKWKKFRILLDRNPRKKKKFKFSGRKPSRKKKLKIFSGRRPKKK